MSDRLECNAITMELISTPQTDEWRLTTFSNQYILSSDKLTIAADGVEIATISIQRKTPKLLDGSQGDVPGVGSVRIYAGKESEVVDLDENGAGQTTISAIMAGVILIHAEIGNEIEIEAI